MISCHAPIWKPMKKNSDDTEVEVTGRRPARKNKRKSNTRELLSRNVLTADASQRSLQLGQLLSRSAALLP